MTSLSRRAFLQRTIGLSAGAMLYLYSDGSYRIAFAAAGPVTYKLRIIHTNDHHARIEPVSVTIRAANASATPPVTAISRNFGGLARRKTIFDTIRAEATQNNQNILFLDAGDVFQGTLYFNLFNGLADLSLYRQLGYDAMTIGNHEFDRGPRPLAQFITGAVTGTYTGDDGQPVPLPGTNLPVISANISAIYPSALENVIKNGQLLPRITKTVGGEKIGIFGLTTPDTTFLASPGQGTSFADVVATAQAQVAALQAEGVNKIIALTHIGYSEDVKLAKAVSGIDVIVGGHSHTPLRPDADARPLGIAAQGKYPTIETAPDGNSVVIVTDWEWGKWVGDVTIDFDAAGLVAGASGNVLPVWADGIASGRALLTGEEAEVVANPTIVNGIAPFKAKVDEAGKTIVSKVTFKLDGDRENVRNRETNLGNLVADAFLAFARSAGARICITNGGGIRVSIPTGDVSLGQIKSVLPFDNTLFLLTLTGAQLIQALENGVSQIDLATPSNSAGRFPQVAGLRFSWVRNRPAGSRIQRVLVLKTTGIHRNQAQTFEPIDLTAQYRIVTTNFMATGGDGYTVFTQGTNRIDTGLIDSDALTSYVQSLGSEITAPTAGRILTESFYPILLGQKTT